MIKNLAVMTSGGDSPGMNASVRAVVRSALDRGLTVHAIYYGYEGLVEGGDRIRTLTWDDVGGILPRGGTFLGTARSEQFKEKEGRRRAVRNLVERRIEALIVIGGDGSLTGADILATEWTEHVDAITKSDDGPKVEGAPPTLQVIGLPGSIDNDLYGTDMSIGADTALNHIVHAIDDLSSTAASHQRTFVVETMGRHCGYLALAAAIGGSASWVLVPEEELDMRWHQKMASTIEKARLLGRPHQMVIVAEGARHPDGLHISSDDIKRILTERLGIEVRVTVLGHVQRGGSPTVFDRLLATRLGVAAVDTLLDQPDAQHRHMLGLVKNEIVATPLSIVVERSQAIRTEIENGNYEKAIELRPESFRKLLELARTLTRIEPAQARRDDGIVAILTGGADSPGMNAAVGVAGRWLLNQGVGVAGARNSLAGLIKGELVDLDWNELIGWGNRPGSEIGTGRMDLEEEDFKRIAENIERFKIKGLIAIGGWGLYSKIAQIVDYRDAFEAFKIPMILVPATIDNNLPCSDFCIGADTALNNIVDAVDKIRHTAGANRRAFIVEVMGRQSGFLALLSALASGAEKAYIPETGISLAELNRDVETIKTSFQCGKRMVIYLRNEHSSRNYTTDFIRNLLEEESKGDFQVRTAILGHVQRGGIPTAFDRILACRLGAMAAATMLEAMGENSTEVTVLGLSGRGIVSASLSEAFEQMDTKRGRPKRQWFMNLVEAADTLARHAPSCPLEAPRATSK
jgi:6-phosphofructokinase 1